MRNRVKRLHCDEHSGVLNSNEETLWMEMIFGRPETTTEDADSFDTTTLLKGCHDGCNCSCKCNQMNLPAGGSSGAFGSARH